TGAVLHVGFQRPGAHHVQRREWLAVAIQRIAAIQAVAVAHHGVELVQAGALDARRQAQLVQRAGLACTAQLIEIEHGGTGLRRHVGADPGNEAAAGWRPACTIRVYGCACRTPRNRLPQPRRSAAVYRRNPARRACFWTRSDLWMRATK